MSQKHNRLINDAVLEVSINKSPYKDKSRYCNEFSAD